VKIELTGGIQWNRCTIHKEGSLRSSVTVDGSSELRDEASHGLTVAEMSTTTAESISDGGPVITCEAGMGEWLSGYLERAGLA
jgi:hypothetical protein